MLRLSNPLTDLQDTQVQRLELWKVLHVVRTLPTSNIRIFHTRRILVSQAIDLLEQSRIKTLPVIEKCTPHYRGEEIIRHYLQAWRSFDLTHCMARQQFYYL